MKKFKGKKILFLGSNVGTLDMIKYAKENGAYTIVADFLPPEKSFGKQVSDDNVLISTNDIERLKEYIEKKKIDGVFAGVSEFNLLNAMSLCEYFGFPFYCTKKQWDSIENKELFYIMSRGFTEKEAMKLIVRAKFNSILDSIKNEELKSKIIEQIDLHLK